MRSLALLLLLFPCIAVGKGIVPFTSDGCSLFPDGKLENRSLWIECCIQHDLTYWRGGTEAEREQADSALKQCVTDLGEPEIAKLMEAGVRAGGSPYFPTYYRWGYGWPYARGYKPLNDEEKQQVKARLNELQQMLERASNTLK